MTKSINKYLYNYINEGDEEALEMVNYLLQKEREEDYLKIELFNGQLYSWSDEEISDICSLINEQEGTDYYSSQAIICVEPLEVQEEDEDEEDELC